MKLSEMGFDQTLDLAITLREAMFLLHAVRNGTLDTWDLTENRTLDRLESWHATLTAIDGIRAALDDVESPHA